MEGPRIPQAEEFPQIVEFLNNNLRAKEAWSILDEYPTALNPHNVGNIRVILENGEIVSHAVIRPLLVKTPVGIFKVAGLGSVVTSEKHRAKGHSRAILESCIQEAKKQACDFVILWTNLYDFYRRFQFELAGTEVTFILDRDLPEKETGLVFRDSPNVAPEAISRVFNQHTVATIRTIEDVRKYLQIPNSHVFTAWDRDGQLKAYAIEGKGADLQGYVHEWGGSVPSLFALLNFARRSRKKPLTWMVPGHSQNLIRQLDDAGFTDYRGFLGMIKITNPPTLFSKIMRYARQTHGIDLVLEKRDNIFLIDLAGNRFQTDSEVDIVRLLFGPTGPSDLHKFDPGTLSALDKIFPIPMWIWGWDSI